MRSEPLLRVALPALLVLPLAIGWAFLTLDPSMPQPIFLGLAALAMYLASHALRVVRMVVLLGDRAASLRGIAVAHALTAPVTGQLPFKVGELVRLVALGRASGGLHDGLKAIWMERAFDAMLLALAGGTALWLQPDRSGSGLRITALAVAVLVGTFVALRLVPETLRNTKAFLIRRYTTDWSLVALSVLDRIGRWLEDAHRMVDGRVATLTLLTVLLWGLEISAFRVGMAGLPVDRATVSSVLGLLSDVMGTNGHATVGTWLWMQFVGQCLVALAGAILWAMHHNGRRTKR